ncbi:MAG: hypothetical protein JSV38_12090 [Desulfobacterales bacterium]|nr:MAG: hypothetical protein JSV38_12090 [Desulfobacterales bacterium]
MNHEKNRHLNMDQLLKAVIDKEDLTLSMQQHLGTCPQCATAKEKIEQPLQALSQMAEEVTPLTMRSIVLPEKKTGWQVLGLRPVLGIATAICLVVFVVWWPGRFKPSHVANQQVVMNQELQEAEQLMIDVGTVVENALPQAYQDVLTVFETESEEDFMQFIVPVVGPNDSASLLSKKEVGRC